MLENAIAESQVNTAATLYYLYRLAGSPLGDSHAGLQAWIESAVMIPFAEFAEREAEGNTTIEDNIE